MRYLSKISSKNYYLLLPFKYFVSLSQYHSSSMPADMLRAQVFNLTFFNVFWSNSSPFLPQYPKFRCLTKTDETLYKL